MRFICLAYEEERKLNELSQNEWSDLREETLSYVEELREQGVLISAQPLQSARKAQTVQIRNGQQTVTDGPFAETKEQLGGFFLIEAADQEEAVAIAAKWPSARLGTIEIRPLDQGLNESRRYT